MLDRIDVDDVVTITRLGITGVVTRVAGDLIVVDPIDPPRGFGIVYLGASEVERVIDDWGALGDAVYWPTTAQPVSGAG